VANLMMKDREHLKKINPSHKIKGKMMMILRAIMMRI